ncbi:VOC family protein [Streptomyces sp. MH13]|uniref:VOC family protein n=1 Tax=Streptomyces sp. MH13 TaxID=3417651 RepID=UPI003CE6F9ED
MILRGYATPARGHPACAGGTALGLLAGIPVGACAAAPARYERLPGAPPTFVANGTEAGWVLGEHRPLGVEHRPGRAGRATQTAFVDDLHARVAAIAERGPEPARREAGPNGVREAGHRDPGGNEIGFGGAPR